MKYRHELKQEISPADGSALIDASALNISDMGGMDKTMGEHGGQFPAADENARPGMGGRSAFQD